MDHDVFSNVPLMVQHLRNLTDLPHYIGGQLNPHSPAVRAIDDKWFTPWELYPEDYYPPYVDGPCYFLSGAVVPLIYGAALKEKLFHFEDIFITGLIPRDHLHLPVQNVSRSHIYQTERLVTNVKDLVTIHPTSPQKMYEYYNLTVNP
ncbi:unnamed protein product [Allacma fusca]|uniref:Hexosyltransferase n=1 Tax=Allacma fusca TaxID=39272 RepID=A0A8J2KY13_9HEXA|nr:unnamed protein product [Allacma fusca]